MFYTSDKMVQFKVFYSSVFSVILEKTASVSALFEAYLSLQNI